MKAMILAAGRGMRLRPLTDHTPKPLLPLYGAPLVTHLLRALAAGGITEIVMNVSYLADKIQATLGDGEQYGVRIHYSVEPSPLETGGGIYQALPLLGTTPFLVISADIYTDYPWENWLARASTVTHAHLLLVDNPIYHLTGDYGLNNTQVIFHDTCRYTYGSCAIIHPQLFNTCQPGFFRLSQVWQNAIHQGFVTGEHYAGIWHNIGSINELEILNNA